MMKVLITIFLVHLDLCLTASPGSPVILGENIIELKVI